MHLSVTTVASTSFWPRRYLDYENLNLLSLMIHGYELPVVATSLISGRSLEGLIRTRNLTFDELGILAFDVTKAISCMWERRIVHRDLKPSNIVMTPSGRACVIDLGLARHVDLSTLTAVGTTWGTPGYFSPEQARAVKQLTCKSDLYTLGIILVEGGLGRHPSMRDQHHLFTLHLHENLPIELADWQHAALLKRLLDPQPTKRPMPSKMLNWLAQYAPAEQL